MVLVSILLVLAIISGIIFMIYPTINTPNEQELTTHDGLEDVVVDEKTIHVKTHDKDRVKEEVIEATVITTNDFVDKKTEIDVPSATEEFQNTIGGKQLTEHIASVIQLHPDSKKHLNKRQRKTVEKIVKEKKSWNPGYYDLKGNFIEYEKRWYCNANKIIHGTEKEFLNCNHCNKE